MDKRHQTSLQKIISAYDKYNTCVRKHCKKQLDALQSAAKIYRDELNILQEKLVKQKITFDKFNKEVTKTLSKIKSLDENKKVTECSLTNCKKDFISLLDVILNEFNKDKSINKRYLKEVKYIKKKTVEDTLIPDDFNNLMNILRKP